MTTAQTLLPIVVRDADEADLSAVQAIYAHHVRHGLATFEEIPPDLAEITRRYRELRSRGMPYLAADYDGAVRGYAYAGPFRQRSAYRHTVEDSVYVDAGLGGRGIGRALLSELMWRCTALGYRQMIAVIGDSGNTSSIGLHTALGFVWAGVLKSVGLKHGRWVDCVIMQRILGDGDSNLPR
jgi:phosphinothricin acetyltransferase